MKSATAIAAILALVSLSLHGQSRDMDLIRTVRDMPASKLDPAARTADSLSFARYLALTTRVPVESLQWGVNDCGEGGDGRQAPTCVEVQAELAPDVTLSVSASVTDTDGNPGPPGLFMMYMKKGSQVTFANSMRELFVLMAPILRGSAAPASPASGGIAGITAIALERTACFGACPVDRLELRLDGTALYTGEKNTRLSGQFTGAFAKKDFDELARWLAAEGYFDLNTSYGDPNVDLPTQVIRVARNGKSKWVVNYSINRSMKVLAMERVITAFSEAIEWKPAGNAAVPR